MEYIKSVSSNPFTFMKGYKSYIIGALAVFIGWYKGDMNLIMYGLGLMSLRAGIKTAVEELLLKQSE